MMITRKPLPRRAFLRGLGTVMALPLLDAMVPNKAAAAEALTPRRLSIYYMPNGMIMPSFVPTEVGEGYALSPTLKRLEAHRGDFTFISGMAQKNATAMGDGPGDHGRSCANHLTATHPRKTEGYDLQAGISMDQYVAKALASQTQIASLELGIEPPSFVGSCDSGYSCAYSNTLSWSSPTTPMPIVVNPREVFERLFGYEDKIDPASRLAAMRRQASILDFVRDDTIRISNRVSTDDIRKLDEYMTAIRDLERRIQVAEKGGGTGISSDLVRPPSAPTNFHEHIRMMMDLQILAMRADMTRVSSLMAGRELSNRSYTEIGIPDSHHSMSHHGNDPEKIAKIARINEMFLTEFAYYLSQLKAAKEGDGTLLDRTIAMAGASLGDPNTHDHMDIAAIIAGGTTRNNRHFAMPKETPKANLLVAVMHQMGVEQNELGDSSGVMSEVFV